MNHWLLKSEPDCYSIDDLRREKKTRWGGVRNYQARNFLQAMRSGDLCVFYHSGAEPPCAAGICVVTGEAEPDVTQFDPSDDHYDPRSTEEKPLWYAPEIGFRSVLAHPVAIGAMRANRALAKMRLLEKGSRLSVTPLTAAEFAEIERLGAGK
jgi:predicted RNA-binding protein with PUA-like domain